MAINNCSSAYTPILQYDDDNAEAEALHLQQPVSSFLQTFFNCVSLLLGLGMLACPYAVQKAGWSILPIGLLCIPAVYLYTAVLLKRCFDRYVEAESFEDLSEKAYGKWGLRLFMTLFYMEIYATLVSYGISIADNLMELVDWGSRQSLTAIVTLVVLPTMWLPNMRALSIMSMCSVISVAAVIACFVWLAITGSIAFSGEPLTAARPTWIPVSTSIFLFNYSGHVVLPGIYLSMQDKSKFTKAITLSFTIATVVYGGLGVLGALMFGDAVKSQITLNLPSQHVASIVALWLTVVAPITKFALMLSPISAALERALPWSSKTKKHAIVSLFARSCLAVSVFLVALFFPFFSYVLALIGATLSISLCVIFPCLFYLKLMGDSLDTLQRNSCVGVIALAAVVGVTCTGFSLRNYVTNHTIIT